MPNHLVRYNENVTIADLTPRQAKFVQAYLECGTQRDGAIQAALAAGYGNNNRAQAKSRAYEMLHNPRILAVLRDEIGKKLSAAAAIGAEVLVELAQSANSEQVRLGAARELLDRGYGPIMSRNAAATADDRPMTIEDLIASLPEVEGQSVNQPPADRRSAGALEFNAGEIR
jgi:Terminase small subunit